MSEANVTESKKGPTPKKEKVKGAPKVRTGYVVSDKMSKTIVVEIEDRKQHALYGKIMRSHKKVKAPEKTIQSTKELKKLVPGKATKKSAKKPSPGTKNVVKAGSRK